MRHGDEIYSERNIVSRREVKSKGEKERYKHLNAEFQRIVRRDKKAFLSDQCKEIEENNRMGKTRDLFKKIRDTKGTFYKKMGSIKDRNGMDLTEAEDIKKRWQEYTEELYKKDLHVLCALTSDFTGGCPPPPSHSLCQRVHLQLQFLKFLVILPFNFQLSLHLERGTHHAY